MKLLCAGLLALVALQLSPSDDALYGTWKMRPAVPGSKSSQVQTITKVAGGMKVDTVIDMGNGTTMSMTYTTKFDGAEVPVYSEGKVVMTLRGKKTGPNTYEGSVSANGMTTQSRTTISADGKVLTVESIGGKAQAKSVFDRVK